MPHSSKHKYLRASLLSLALFALGLLLQLLLGPVPASYFNFPVNIWGGILLVLILSLIYLRAPKNRYVLELSSAAVAIVFSVSIGLCSIVMGSVVLENPHSLGYKLGLGSITTSWYFALFFLVVLINLWWAMLRRAGVLTFANIVFLINHMGLFLTLYGAFLGQGDIQRFNMTLRENEVEWRAYQELAPGQFRTLELPFALYLKDFSMQSYPNKLYVVNQEGKALPEHGKPVHALLGEDSQLNLLGYQIRVHQYLPRAILNQQGLYVAAQMWGTTNAAQLSIAKDGKQLKDTCWLGAGNFLFPGRSIALDSQHSLIMASPEAKKFVSQVLVYEKDADSSKRPFAAEIAVNHPLTVAGWKIYQTSYDENMGEWSTSSIVELIRDPWLPVVYVGLGLLIVGSLLFLFKLRKLN